MHRLCWPEPFRFLGKERYVSWSLPKARLFKAQSILATQWS